VSDTSKKSLKVSREGMILIKSFEGFRPRATPREGGGWVIGYGHTLSAREGAAVSEAEAELLLQYDLLPVVRRVSDLSAGRLNQHQFDAIASFVHSIGLDRFETTDVASRLASGALDETADALIASQEPVQADAALRRRAAERALFVASPDHVVTLADLLGAPLPLPLPGAAPASVAEPGDDAADQPVIEPAQDARAAALASLLGETPSPSDGSRDAAASVEMGEPGALEVSAEEAVQAAPPAVSAPAEDTRVPVADAFQFQRFSPYGATVVGPLPGLGRISQSVPGLSMTIGQATAPVASPVAEIPAEIEPVAEPTQPVTTIADSDAVDTSGTVPEVEPEPALMASGEMISPEPASDDAATDVAVAGQPVPEEAPAQAEPPAGIERPAAPSAYVAPEPVGFVTPVFAAAPVVDPFPPMAPATETIIPNFGASASAFSHAPSLELTPPEQDTAPVVRPVWGEAERQAPVSDQEPLFEDDSGLVSVLRHEEPDVPQRFDWSQTGAFAIMGGVGLVAAVSSAAAFRLSIESPSPMGETTIVAWTLAVIGGVCVVVSVWNLYPRLFPAKGE